MENTVWVCMAIYDTVKMQGHPPIREEIVKIVQSKESAMTWMREATDSRTSDDTVYRAYSYEVEG